MDQLKIEGKPAFQKDHIERDDYRFNKAERERTQSMRRPPHSIAALLSREFPKAHTKITTSLLRLEYGRQSGGKNLVDAWIPLEATVLN